jgi:hypothetical protein
MGVKFDKILGKLREDDEDTILSVTGWSGQATNFAALPAVADHNGEYYHVLNSSGTWFINRKPSGTYYSDGVSWTYVGDLINAFQDGNFSIYNAVDNTKEINFSAASITTGNIRTITMCDEDIDLGAIADSNIASAATWNAKGDVSKVGTPVNNQIGVWTGDGTLEGDADLTWSGTVLSLDTPSGDTFLDINAGNSTVGLRIKCNASGITQFRNLSPSALIGEIQAASSTHAFTIYDHVVVFNPSNSDFDFWLGRQTSGRFIECNAGLDKMTLAGTDLLIDGAVEVNPSYANTDCTFYAEQQTGAITAFADAGGGDVTVTSAGHGLGVGDEVTISGTTNYNGTFRIQARTVNTFDITDTWVSDDATGTWVDDPLLLHLDVSARGFKFGNPANPATADFFCFLGGNAEYVFDGGTQTTLEVASASRTQGVQIVAMSTGEVRLANIAQSNAAIIAIAEAATKEAFFINDASMILNNNAVDLDFIGNKETSGQWIDRDTGNDTTRIGDAGGSDYIEIEGDGDLNFVGGAGLQYGSVYGEDTATTITISGTGVANKVQITAFDTNGVSNGSVTPDHTNNHLTVGKAGDYDIKCYLTCESVVGAAANFGFQVFINNGATIVSGAHAHRYLAGGGSDVGSVALGNQVALSANDTVEVWVWNDTNTQNVVISDITLVLTQIGG